MSSSGSGSDSATETATSTSGGSMSTTDPSATSMDTNSDTDMDTDTDSDDPTGSTGDACEGEDMCGPCPFGMEAAGCVDGEWSCTCVPVEDPCALEPFVCNFVGGSINPGDIIDCGVVTLQDSAQDYIAARDCVLEASANLQVYKMFAQVQGIDSDVWWAYGSFAGDSYQETIYFYDEGKLAGGEFIWAQTCTPEPTPDCEPGPTDSAACLSCDTPSEQVCADPL